MKEKKKRKQ